MEAEVAAYLRAVGWAIAGGALLWLVRLVVTLYLRGRVTPELAPSLSDLSRPDNAFQLVALIGHKAAVTETTGTLRLRATLGLRLAWWGGAFAMAVAHNLMRAPTLGIETVLLVLVLGMAFRMSIFEITFDRNSITFPRWWFGRTTHPWRDLLAIGRRDRWYVTFDFHKGQRVYVPRHVVGYDRLIEAARKALRES